jgi:perosamine synthetase
MPPPIRIPLSAPAIAGNEWKYVKQCLDTAWLSSSGSFVKEFEQKMAAWTGATHAVALSSGTAALHLMLMLAEVKAGDYVILPNLTFAASANAIRYVGAEPLFIDVDSETWQMDQELLESFLSKTEKTEQGRPAFNGKTISAIMPVHVLGGVGDIQRLQHISRAHSLPIIEDAAEALGSYHEGKHAGTFGRMGALSFNGNKIMTTGGGGMLLSNDEGLASRARHLSRQAKIDPVEYVHDSVGYNYRMGNVQAAIGLAQLEQMDGFLKKKKAIAERYKAAFAAFNHIVPQNHRSETSPNHWLYTVRVPNSRELMASLASRGIESRPLWRPMNQLPMYREQPYIHSDDVSGMLNKECLSIPCSTGLSERDQEEVIRTVITEAEVES